MEQEVLEFISKIYVERKSTRPIIRMLAKIILVLYILIFLFVIWMEGFSFKMITANALPLLLLLYVMNSTKPVAG